jgi:predicted esterase
MKSNINKNIVYFLIAFSFLFFSNSIFAGKKQTIKLKNGTKAILYLPNNFSVKKRYPILMVLHGLREGSETPYKFFKPIADENNFILICPQAKNTQKGYQRKPIDDRKNFVYFMNLLDQKYNVNFAKSILAGFSRGGNFALETALLYPRKFNNVLCLFGFYNKNFDNLIVKNSKKKLYRYSKFYLITGKKDLTKESLTYCHKLLNTNAIPSYLKIHRKLTHCYPPNLAKEMKAIRTWLYDKSKKAKLKKKTKDSFRNKKRRAAQNIFSDIS